MKTNKLITCIQVNQSIFKDICKQQQLETPQSIRRKKNVGTVKSTSNRTKFLATNMKQKKDAFIFLNYKYRCFAYKTTQSNLRSGSAVFTIYSQKRTKDVNKHQDTNKINTPNLPVFGQSYYNCFLSFSLITSYFHIPY